VDLNDRDSIGAVEIELFESIGWTGSIAQAARDMGIGYRHAWGLIQDVNATFDQPVVLANTGGREGGGATLTEVGKKLVAAYRILEAEIQSLATSRLRDLSKHVKVGVRSGPRLASKMKQQIPRRRV
jgi:molybdate transport system regulatory protein